MFIVSYSSRHLLSLLHEQSSSKGFRITSGGINFYRLNLHTKEKRRAWEKLVKVNRDNHRVSPISITPSFKTTPKRTKYEGLEYQKLENTPMH